SNLQLHVLDASLQLAPPGALGELFIGGVGVGRGYLNRPELTAERFLPNPFGPPGSRLYRTGDVCRFRDDGNLQYLGRADFQVKVRGFRIELGEVEAALRSLPLIRDCAVVAHGADADKRLVAYLVAAPGFDTSSTRDALASALPEYMVPSAFVTLDAL